jgi:hypothetical protein
MIRSTVLPLRGLVSRRRGFHALAAAVSAVALSAVALSACASKTAGSPRTEAAPQAHSSRYLLVQADLEKSRADNVYEAIEKLRPEFLRGHGDPTSFIKQDVVDKRDPNPSPPPSGSTGGAVLTAPTSVKVYRDNARLSGVDDLRQMPIAGIAEIRYIPGPEAGVKYGTDHAGGVILIKSK